MILIVYNFEIKMNIRIHVFEIKLSNISFLLKFVACNYKIIDELFLKLFFLTIKIVFYFNRFFFNF